MISPVLIVLSAVLSGGAVFAAARLVRWQVRPALLAGAGTLLLVVLWRLIANALGVNDDFLPAVSTGDAGCLIAGGLPPAVAAMMNRGLQRRAVPAIAGALAAFVINVVIL
ncbi:hypothetical protein [Arthrobacter sp. FW306-04-A]|uniref:hypothetical protein n=1 Tax=Arthrobacter sp. FW306-04-A TaxID=2879619 RepID=UPI0037C03669|nr:hypothetical protein LFT43_00805 [Arthrobacter sp. FW306-04-A]